MLPHSKGKEVNQKMRETQGTPRVLELLEEMAHVLRDIKANDSEINSKIGGVLDALLMKIEEAQHELARGNSSLEKLMPLVSMVANLIEVIARLKDTLFYTICCFVAALYRQREAHGYWQKHKIISHHCRA